MLFKSQTMSEASGSAGGLTASRNRFGAYMRARVMPVNPASAYQQVVRNALSTLTARWQNVLTDAQRQAWETYGINVPMPNALGDPVNLTGLNHYIRSNTPRIQAGCTLIDDGPVVFSLPVLTPLTAITATAGTENVAFAFDNTDPWANEDNGHLLIASSRQQAPTINFFKGPYRYQHKEDGNSVTPPTSPSSYTSTFNLDAGNNVFLLARASRADGRLSSPFRGQGAIS
jgi:hypothetical protein